jgi:hypothetical protein
MAKTSVLLELDAEEVLAYHADALALHLASDGTVFVPRPGIDPRARSAVPMPTAIVVRIESSAGEAAIADWLVTTAGQLSSGWISAKAGNRSRIFKASDRNTIETLRSLTGE